MVSRGPGVNTISIFSKSSLFNPGVQLKGVFIEYRNEMFLREPLIASACG
jgi:hypothetical protein